MKTDKVKTWKSFLKIETVIKTKNRRRLYPVCIK